MEQTTGYLVGLPDFLLYFSTSVAMLIIFTMLYWKITPHNEWKLMRENNTAASIAYGGSILGFVLPVYSAISHSVNLVDFLIWSSIAFLVQISTFLVIRFFIKDLSERICKGENASGTLVAVLSIAVGLLNAASMSY